MLTSDQIATLRARALQIVADFDPGISKIGHAMHDLDTTLAGHAGARICLGWVRGSVLSWFF